MIFLQFHVKDCQKTRISVHSGLMQNHYMLLFSIIAFSEKVEPTKKDHIRQQFKKNPHEFAELAFTPRTHKFLTSTLINTDSIRIPIHCNSYKWNFLSNSLRFSTRNTLQKY